MARVRRGLGAPGLVLIVAACASCQADAGRDASLGRDADEPGAVDSASEADGGRESDADQEPDQEAGPGPVTLAVGQASVLVDRLCDLDGDGLADNAVADLGSPSDELFATSVTLMIQGSIESGRKMILHFPWIDDLSGPDDSSAVFIIFTGRDDDDPEDPSDDLSGHEGYVVTPSALDVCGEPTVFFRDVRLEQGELSALSGAVPLPAAMVATSARTWGTVAPFGTSASLLVCGIALIRDFGPAGGTLPMFGDSTALEIILAGGAAFGYPQLPGLVPDVDVDGDGLERFTLDASSRIESCIDGDGTVIAGRDCWANEAMADGFSLNFRFDAVSAQFLGQEEGWQENPKYDGLSCDDPPDPSLFDPV